MLPDGVNRPDPEMFDGVETALSSLAAYAGAHAAGRADGRPDADRVERGRRPRRRGRQGLRPRRVAPLAAGLKAVRALRADLGTLGLNDAGRYEIDFRLAQKEPQFEQALVLAADVRLEAVADDDLVIAGQPVDVRVIAANRGGAAITAGATLAGLTSPAGDCAPAPVAAAARASASSPPPCRPMPGSPRRTSSTRPTRRSSCSIPTCRPGCRSARRRSPPTSRWSSAGKPVTVPVNVESRSEGNIFSGEKRAELHVVPKFAVTRPRPRS